MKKPQMKIVFCRSKKGCAFEPYEVAQTDIKITYKRAA